MSTILSQSTGAEFETDDVWAAPNPFSYLTPRSNKSIHVGHTASQEARTHSKALAYAATEQNEITET